jgi:hypothetical protein
VGREKYRSRIAQEKRVTEERDVNYRRKRFKFWVSLTEKGKKEEGNFFISPSKCPSAQARSNATLLQQRTSKYSTEQGSEKSRHKGLRLETSNDGG